jgi:putative exporter of polyketide antibiotics
MSGLLIFAVVALLVLLLIITEMAAAVLPLLIVVTLVPPAERGSLADVLAAADSRRRLRLWSALRVAVKARRSSLQR